MLWSRIGVLLVSSGYLLVAYSSGEPRFIVGTVIFLAFPVAMVWFADDLASGTGFFIESHRVTAPSPPGMVKLFGFVILLAPALALFL